MNAKIIRNKNTAVSEGYGFVEFATHEAAEQVLRTFNGCPIPNTDQIFRLNWAAFGVGKVTTDCEPLTCRHSLKCREPASSSKLQTCGRLCQRCYSFQRAAVSLPVQCGKAAGHWLRMQGFAGCPLLPCAIIPASLLTRYSQCTELTLKAAACSVQLITLSLLETWRQT